MEQQEIQPQETEQQEIQPQRQKGKNKKRDKKRDKKNRKGPLALLALLLILALAGGFWWWSYNQKMDNTTKYWFDKMAENGSLAGKTPQEVQGMLNSIVEEGMFHVSVNARAVFENGKSEGSLGIENVPENQYYCRVVLRNNTDGSILYQSEGLKPGQYIDKVKLKQNLPAGEYPCTARVIATDPETLDDVGQVEVEVQVIVVD